MLHRLCGPPSIPLSFNLAIVLPRRDTHCVSCATQCFKHQTARIHRLQHGLPGYLILFATHAFVPQRQLCPSRPPSPLVFLLISTNFTSTPGILPAPDLSRLVVSKDPPGLSPGLSPPTYYSACAPFTPVSYTHLTLPTKRIV